MKNSRRRRHCHMSRPDLRKRHTPRQRRTFAMPALPAHMTAIAIRAPGGPDMLVPEQRPLPRPGDAEVLVKVAAAGVNRPDVMQRRGLYPPPAGAIDIPGLEIAGEVAALGVGVKQWKLGDKVMALVVGGGYAEYCPAHESHALPVPPGLALVAAAAIPETFFTVWHNAFERGRLKAGETLLVHGGSSGIGTTAIQLAKSFGARLIITAGSGPTSRLTIRAKISSPRPRPPQRARAQTSFSTWSAATISSATTKPRRSKGAWCKSRCRRAPRPRSISIASCSSASLTRARRCARARSRTKAPSRAPWRSTCCR